MIFEYSCNDNPGDPLPSCDIPALEPWEAECEDQLHHNRNENALKQCRIGKKKSKDLRRSCKTDICGVNDDEDLIKAAICNYIREAISICDSFDVKLENLPDYCKCKYDSILPRKGHSDLLFLISST